MYVKVKKQLPLADLEFNKLFAGQIFSHSADAVVQFLFAALLMQMDGSAGKAIAAMFFIFLLPQFLLSPFSGILCGRFSRKAILSISCLFRFCIVLAVIFLLPQLSKNLIYSAAFLLGAGAAFFYPAKMSAVTNIVESSRLKFANALMSSFGAIALLFGAFAANFLIKYGSIQAFSVIAAMYLAAAVLTALIKFSIPQKFSALKRSEKESTETQMHSGVKAVIHYLKKHKRALHIVLLSICLQFIAAVFSNSLNALITDYYRLEFSDLTFLRTLLGIGMALGMASALYFAKVMRIPHLFASGFMILCLALITAPLCRTLSSAWLWLIPIGMADAVIIIMLDTILQKIMPDRLRGSIFGIMLTVNTFSFLTGTAIAAQAAGVINPLITFKAVSVLSFAAALIVLLFDKSFRYFLLKASLGHIFLLLFKYRVEGAENIPKKGRCILAGNHTGHLDPFIVQMASHRQFWFVTGPAAFNVPVIRHFLKYFNVLPLQFGKGLEAIDAAVQKLKAGDAVIIFPEGKFTPDGNLCRFSRGIGIMAEKADAPIIPFAIQGGFETWGEARRFPKLFNEIVIQFAQPLEPDRSKDAKETAFELQMRVNFMKKSLERRQFYKIDHKLHSNFLDLMQEKGDIYGSNTALAMKTKDGYQELSYIELSRKAKKFANYLIETNKAHRGDRIAVLCESRIEFAIGIFASIQTGAVTVPLDIKLTVPEHTHILNDCNPKILLCSSHYLEHALEVKNNVPSIEHIFVLDDENREHPEIPSISELEADTGKDLGRVRSLDDTALIVYTSGTTGNPKGVMISFGNIYSQLRDFEQIFKLTKKHTLLSILPLNHLLELDCGFFGMLYMGAETVYINSLTPKELTAVMQEKGITNMIVVPLIAKMLKNSIEKQVKKQPEQMQKAFKILYAAAKYMPLKVRRLMFKSVIDGLGGKLECFISGGAPLEDSTAEFFYRIGIPVFQGYGLTETSPVISSNHYSASKIGTAGRALPSVRVKIADNGEILASGPNVMQGYYNKPEMTKEAIDEEGWFHTGDIGEIDKDGFIKITGRIKNMIVLAGGKKIFPEEVEAVLETSALIKEVCVMSVTVKTGSKAGTEEVCAVICPADELQKKSDDELLKLLEEEVKKLSAANLAAYKAPSIILLHREELPKTSTRKVKRKELQDWYAKL